jgi:SAM-dependent methyltransferase
MKEFDPRSYWEQRLARSYTLGDVGWLGLGLGLNTWMYRVRRHVFLKALRPFLSDPRSVRILDVGSGTGFYVDRWHELGVVAVTGSDLTQTAVERLGERHPTDEFVHFDVGGDELPFEPASFDAISAMDVLFHIMDDERFARAFRNIATLLKPGGVFAFSENCLHGHELRTRNWASRPLADIQALLSAAALEIVERRPMFVLLNAPVDSRSPILHTSWRLVTKLARTRNAFGKLLGAALYPLERVLVSRLREGPSTELVICRRLNAAPLSSHGVAAAARMR